MKFDQGGDRCNASIVGNYRTGDAGGGRARFAKPCGNKAGPDGYCWRHKRKPLSTHQEQSNG